MIYPLELFLSFSFLYFGGIFYLAKIQKITFITYWLESGNSLLNLGNGYIWLVLTIAFLLILPLIMKIGFSLELNSVHDQLQAKFNSLQSELKLY